MKHVVTMGKKVILLFSFDVISHLTAQLSVFAGDAVDYFNKMSGRFFNEEEKIVKTIVEMEDDEI